MTDVAKLSGYAVTSGGFTDKVSASKITAYAVTNDADTHASAAKVVGYAVTANSAATVVRPQICAIT